MTELNEYILSEAKTDWIGDYLGSESVENDLCTFVKRMVVEAMMDSKLAHKYLKDFDENS